MPAGKLAGFFMRWTELLADKLNRGDSLDSSLAELRRQGAGMLDAVKAVREAKAVPLAEAKRLVLGSPAWQEFQGPHEQLTADILAVLDEIEAQGRSNT